MALTFLDRLQRGFQNQATDGQFLENEATRASESRILEDELMREQNARTTAANALIQLESATNAGDAQIIIGEAIAQGAPPEIFTAFTESMLAPEEVLGDGGTPQLMNRFGAVRQQKRVPEKKAQTEVTIHTGQDTKDAKAVAVDEATVANFNEIQEGVRSNRKLDQMYGSAITNARRALDRSPNTGTLANAQIIATNFIDALGIPIDKSVTSDLEQFRLAVNQLTLPAMEHLKGAMSEKELVFLKNTLANLGTSVEANMIALVSMEEMKKRNAEKFALYDGIMRDKTLNNEQKFDQVVSKITQYEDANPVEKLTPIPPPVDKNGRVNTSGFEVGQRYVVTLQGGTQKYGVWDGENLQELF